MARYKLYTIKMQISRLFDQGQSFFAVAKVQDWLRERGHNPDEYDILFHQVPAPPGSPYVMLVETELRRRDGQPVDSFLQEELNRSG
ncbi:hypothetical protein BST81_19835 [Leptolyngbya sp. 'hensonii']|uniref:hypothetical protein n=1 Tax=Leptolyngbya sp. 'hensonii' TaxID=1922337 RepID=UPI0009500C54|nr:hypothetical protein [Leptolyngbya sp. 'hensonii']OLP16691.1 hypothetical protein BST81_19835 [Leptolyngbya sp. 'hensonii']